MFISTNMNCPWVRQQENSSFANFGRESACAICECAVLCVGFSFYLFSNCKVTSVVSFLGLLVTSQ
jgi:hypothetical protein